MKLPAIDGWRYHCTVCSKLHPIDLGGVMIQSQLSGFGQTKDECIDDLERKLRTEVPPVYSSTTIS